MPGPNAFDAVTLTSVGPNRVLVFPSTRTWTVDGVSHFLSGVTDLIVNNTRYYAGAWVFDQSASPATSRSTAWRLSAVSYAVERAPSSQ